MTVKNHSNEPMRKSEKEVIDYLMQLKYAFNIPFIYAFIGVDEADTNAMRPITFFHDENRSEDAFEALKMIFKENNKIREMFCRAIKETETPGI